MRIGAQTNPLKPLEAEVARVAADSFDYIEIIIAAPGAAPESTAWRTLAARCADLALPVVCQTPAYLPLANPSPIVRQAALDELRRAVDAAAILGARLLSLPWPGWPEYMIESDGYLFTRQWLNILTQHAQAQDVTVALINSPQNRHQLKYFREIFHRVPALRFTYDIGHSNVGVPQSLTRDYLFALADRLELVHLSDNDGTADQHLPPGAPQSGGIDLDHELRTLRTFRFDGDITLQALGNLTWLRLGRDRLRAAWDALL